MSSLRLATIAVFLTAILDFGAWIATQFLGLQIQSELGRGLSSLFLGGLLVVLGWLMARGNKLAILLAIGLSLFDLMTGACLSAGTYSVGGIGDVVRAVLLFAMLPGLAAIRREPREPSPKVEDEVPELTEPEHSVSAPPVRDVQPAAVGRLRSRKKGSEAKPADPIRRRFARAMFGLLALVGCSLGFMIWETAFQCDPRQPWDMQLGCVLRPDPTPGPFPIQGVRQLTFDASHYEKLAWSPAGDNLLATRCEVIQREAQCYLGGPPVLIDLVNGTVNDLDLSWYPTPSSRLEFYSYAWSSDGEEVLLDFTEVFLATAASPTTPSSATAQDRIWRRVALNRATGGYREIATGEVLPIAWYDEQGRVFGFRKGEYDLEARESIDSFGWFDYELDQWQEEMKLSSSYYGRTLTLSPDRKTLLLGRDLSNSSCLGQVLVYQVGDRERGFTDLRGICFPAFSQDGSKLAFSMISESDIWPRGVWISEADGSDPEPVFVVDQPESTSSISWSPDGSRIAFTYGYHFNAIYVIDIPEHLRP